MSEQYNVIILPEAQKDIRNIVLYISQELAAPQAALSLQEEFRNSILSLEKLPKRIKLVNEHPWKNKGIRKLHVKNYYVYFLVDDDEHTVKIIAVIYAGRDQYKHMTDRSV